MSRDLIVRQTGFSSDLVRPIAQEIAHCRSAETEPQVRRSSKYAVMQRLAGIQTSILRDVPHLDISAK